MPDNEFGLSISSDFAPEGSLCEWCGKPAVEQLTVIGGKRHNETGFFCHTCGEKFVRAVADPHSRVLTTEATIEREALSG
jgi:transposase-like protein